MTERKIARRRKLAHEILGLIGICALCTLILFLVLSNCAAAIIEIYCLNNDIVMTEFDWLEADRWVFSVTAAICAGFFSLLFLILLGERMAYIRKLTAGIDALRIGRSDAAIPLEGNNELTELADAINFMSATQQLLREKELTLAREKEQLIRTLSHDIRTPLTSILAYSEYLAANKALPDSQQEAQLQMIRRKAQQIRDLTDILLDGGKRNMEHFADAHLLMQQLAAEFEEDLEADFTVAVELSGCPSFAGTFDVQELRRILDNLSSNVKKYADPNHPVCLHIALEANQLIFRQTNRIRSEPRQEDSFRLGLNSIRRIAQYYGGQVVVQEDAELFSITVILSEF